MAPRRRRSFKTVDVLSTDSGNSASNDALGGTPLDRLTRSGKTVLEKETLIESSNIFDLQLESPMRSPLKFGNELLLETPVRKRASPLQFLHPQKPSPKDERSRDLLFSKNRIYDFIRNKNERSLLIFELYERGGDQEFNADKMILTLYQVTSQDNDSQLKWVHSHVDEISNFDSYDLFLTWFRQVSFSTITNRTANQLSLISKNVFQISQTVLGKLVKIVTSMTIIVMSIVSIIFFLHSFGYITEETSAYLRLIEFLFYLAVESMYRA